MDEDKERVVESELKGLTLRIYWHILGSDNKDRIGVRPIQRELGLSSPSVALHHLEKLRTLGLLEKSVTGDYRLVGEIKVGVLKNFVGLLGFLVPRYLFYSTMFTVMLVLYPILYPPNFSVHNIMALVFGITAIVISWSETFRVWRMRPF